MTCTRMAWLISKISSFLQRLMVSETRLRPARLPSGSMSEKPLLRVEFFELFDEQPPKRFGG